MPFSKLGLSPQLLEGVKAMGYVDPTPIQLRAIPLIMEGRDVIGSAQTGTGKTAAFALPILSKLGTHQPYTRMLILEPTRELAAQVETAIRDFARFTDLQVAVVFGGVGAGLYGMLVDVLLAVFIAGLMVGRTPEILGKKVEAREMKLVILYLLIFPLTILGLTAWSVATTYANASVNNAGPHGLSEILYAFTSGAGNNGSAFGGITVSGRFYAVAIAIAMFIGRYWLAVPMLAVAGALAAKKGVPESAGTLPTHGPLFVSLLAGTARRARFPVS